MSIGRIARHILTGLRGAEAILSASDLRDIEQAIQASESRHSGQIRFVVEAALDGAPLFNSQPARDRAIDIFSQLRVWDTAQNNGVLIYLLVADREVEIVADRGLTEKVDGDIYPTICRMMEADFAAGKFKDGIMKGIEELTHQLRMYFPASGSNSNELLDTPVVL